MLQPSALALSFCLLALQGCGSPRPDKLPASASRTPTIETVASSADSGVPVHFRHRDSTLVLYQADGDSVELSNVSSTPDSTVRYYYRHFLPELSFHVVHFVLWEGSGYLLVHHVTGRKVVLAAEPQVSPDSNRLLVTSFSLEGFNENVVQVLTVTKDTVSQEWELIPTGDRFPNFLPGEWGVTHASWLSPDSIVLYPVVLDSLGVQVPQDSVLLTHSAAGWSLSRTLPRRLEVSGNVLPNQPMEAEGRDR